MLRKAQIFPRTWACHANDTHPKRTLISLLAKFILARSPLGLRAKIVIYFLLFILGFKLYHPELFFNWFGTFYYLNLFAIKVSICRKKTKCSSSFVSFLLVLKINEYFQKFESINYRKFSPHEILHLPDLSHFTRFVHNLLEN